MFIQCKCNYADNTRMHQTFGEVTLYNMKRFFSPLNQHLFSFFQKAPLPLCPCLARHASRLLVRSNKSVYLREVTLTRSR